MLALGASAWAESNGSPEPELAALLKADNPGIAYLESLDGIDNFVAPSTIDWRYETVIYINLATNGNTAQRMWVLHRDRDDLTAGVGLDAIGTLIANAGDGQTDGLTSEPAKLPWRLGMWDQAYWDKHGQVPTYSWLVSTGRKYPGDKFSGPTPAGVFNLDERRGRQKLGF